VSSKPPPLTTRVGHADWGDNRYCGFSVGAELAGTETIAGLIALATTGRRLAPEERAVLDDIAVAMTVADALRSEAPELTVAALREPLDRRFREGVRLIGFGVPFRPEDERVRMLRECLVRRGRTGLPYWRTLEAASGAARVLRNLEPNIGLAVAAACLDLGFTPRQISLVCVALGQTDYVANAVEGGEQRPAVLRRLPDAAIEYVGKANRTSPREAGE
jgi:hypothetical protein